LGKNVETRLTATENSIVPAAFDTDGKLIGWFDFEKREWRITEYEKIFG